MRYDPLSPLFAAFLATTSVIAVAQEAEPGSANKLSVVEPTPNDVIVPPVRRIAPRVTPTVDDDDDVKERGGFEIPEDAEEDV